jgi:hypothetical protein
MKCLVSHWLELIVLFVERIKTTVFNSCWKVGCSLCCSWCDCRFESSITVHWDGSRWITRFTHDVVTCSTTTSDIHRRSISIGKHFSNMNIKSSIVDWIHRFYSHHSSKYTEHCSRTRLFSFVVHIRTWSTLGNHCMRKNTSGLLHT